MKNRIERIFKRIGILEPDDKLVKVISWVPWFGGPFGPEWPHMLVDTDNGSQRQHISPCWDKDRLRNLLKVK